jgi:maltose alpha-D-glucosyltransferase/alpha-amylase
MAFHFPLMPRMFMAVQQEDRPPIVEILRQTPDIPDTCQWAMFLRNHDELTLEMVTDEERDYMYQAYASDPQMRINVGIRRRLAPLLGNSRRQIELLNSLLFSMPGTPIVYYGDEIGMGDNIYLGDRNGVRTPMQWTGDRNGGFSRADPARLFAPPIMDPVYGYQAVNVEAQERSPYSILNWMRRMIGLRKQHQVFGRGTIEFLQPENRKVLVYVRRYQDDTVLCVANLSRTVQPVELDLSRFKGLYPVEMTGSIDFPRIGDLPYFLTLAPHGFLWFRLQAQASPLSARTAPEATRAVAESPALLMGASWDLLLEGNVRTLIERDQLVPFLQRQRWFGGKARRLRAARFVDWGLLRRGPQPLFLTFAEAEFEDGSRDLYFLPLAVCGSTDSRAIEERAPGAILARVTGARKGLLFDAWLDDDFASTLLTTVERDESARTRRGAVRAERTAAFATVRGEDPGPLRVRRGSADQSNTSLIYGDRLILKLFRRLEAGVNPDFEISRQLTTRMHFDRVPAVAAALEYDRPGEPLTTVGMLQQLVESQGDGWSHATADLSRFYERTQQGQAPPLPTGSVDDLLDATPPHDVAIAIGAYSDTANRLGRRTAEMHLALAGDPSDSAFAPEPFTRADLDALAARAVAQAERALATLADVLAAQSSDDTPNRLAPEVAEHARRLLESRDALLARIHRLADEPPAMAKIRVHGDYHLGQVLFAEEDFYILDFEGEPARPLAERRLKQPALKDVAGMVRSFSYAAYAALFAHTASQPNEFSRLEPWARHWQTWTTAAFLRGYFAAAGQARFLPRAPRQRDALLRFFVLDKALYELNYELNNRPDWVRIPLRGITELL